MISELGKSRCLSHDLSLLSKSCVPEPKAESSVERKKRGRAAGKKRPGAKPIVISLNSVLVTGLRLQTQGGSVPTRLP